MSLFSLAHTADFGWPAGSQRPGFHGTSAQSPQFETERCRCSMTA